MGFWDSVGRFFTGNSRFNLKNPRDWDAFFRVAQSASGYSVTAESSLKFSAYYAALLIRMRTLMVLPKQIRRRTERGSTLAKDHDQYFLLSKRPNPYQSSRIFWMEFGFNRWHHGNGLAWLEGIDTPSGRATAYHNLHPLKAELDWQAGDLFIKYSARLPDGRYLRGARPYREFLHVPSDVGIKQHGFLWGEPTYEFAKEALGLGLSAEQVTAQYINKEGFLHKFFKHPKRLNREQRKIIADSLKEYRPGESRDKQIPLLDEGMSLESTAINLGDIDPSDLRRFMVEEVARFNTFPALFKLGHHDRSNFANAYQASIEFRDTTVIPDILPIVEEHSYKCLRPSEYRSDEFFTHFETKGLLQADPQQRAEFLQAMNSIGAMTPNLALDIEDMEQRGPEGDIATTQVQNIPLDMLREYWKSIINKATTGLEPDDARNILNGYSTAHESISTS